jgi:hypothetical protein
MLLKTKLLIGTSALILIMGAIIFFGYRQNHRLRLERDQAISFDLARQDTVKQIRQENGKLVSQVEVQDLTIRNTRQLQSDERLTWITQFESVNKRLNNVEQASRFTAKVVANFKIPLRDTTIVMADSTVQHIRTFDNHDEWVRVSGVIMPDTIEVIPYVKIQIKAVLLWERKHKFLGIRFGKKEYFAEGMTDNPYATITGMEVTKIGKKR